MERRNRLNVSHRELIVARFGDDPIGLFYLNEISAAKSRSVDFRLLTMWRNNHLNLSVDYPRASFFPVSYLILQSECSCVHSSATSTSEEIRWINSQQRRQFILIIDPSYFSDVRWLLVGSRWWTRSQMIDHLCSTVVRQRSTCTAHDHLFRLTCDGWRYHEMCRWRRQTWKWVNSIGTGVSRSTATLLSLSCACLARRRRSSSMAIFLL